MWLLVQTVELRSIVPMYDAISLRPERPTEFR